MTAPSVLLDRQLAEQAGLCRDELLTIAEEPRQKKAMRRHALADVLARLCTVTPLTLREMAELTKRQPGYIKRIVNYHTNRRVVLYGAHTHPAPRYVCRETA